MRWEACEAKGTTVEKLLGSIGIGPKKVVAIEVAGHRELDIHRLLQIADRLDVSLDWLMGRTGRETTLAKGEGLTARVYRWDSSVLPGASASWVIFRSAKRGSSPVMSLAPCP